jgi:dephospho-CoA kinase
MLKSGKKAVIGILGGIGSGKSTVANQFAKLGCKVIDTDEIAHELLERADVIQKVKASFGQAIFNSQGKIDRRKLAKIVFEDSAKISILNEIIHPLVLARTEALIKEYSGQNEVKAIVLDMPLLLEVGWEKRCDKVIFVDCRGDLRLQRAEKMGILNEEALKIRENFQISLDKKKSIADNTIDNNSGFEALAEQVADILSDVVSNG